LDDQVFTGADLYRLYVPHILDLARLQEDQPCSAVELNKLALCVPTAEYFLAMVRLDAEHCHILGEEKLRDHFEKSYLEPLQEGRRFVPIPRLIPKALLEKLGEWDDWVWLKNFCSAGSLVPYLLFLNEPVMKNGEPYFTCTLRFGFDADYVP
jgi:hypothetical protein